MGPFSIGIIGEKVPLIPKILVIHRVFQVFAVRILYTTWVICETTWLDAEFNSASNRTIFPRCLWAKKAMRVQKTGLSRFSEVFTVRIHRSSWIIC